jgi:uncharacterized membrane protein YkvA (DUF1232 family)
MWQELKGELEVSSKCDGQNYLVQLKRRLKTVHISRLAKQLRNFILVIPEMIHQIQARLNRHDLQPSLKKLHGFLLTYLYYPVDFVPVARHGFFGYLDDAYLVGSVYLRCIEDSGQRSGPPTTNAESLTRQIPMWLRLTRRVLPKESARIDRMIDDLLHGQGTSFDQMIGREAKVLCVSMR